MSRFEGRSVVVTGAAGGLGGVTALQFVAEGADVLAVDINEAGLADTAAKAADAGGGSISVAVHDVTERDQCHAAIATAVERHGDLDVLANVAGVVRTHHFTDVTEQEFDLIMGVNLGGMFWMCQAAVPHLLESEGNIVNVSSNAGLMGQAYTVAYCSAKAAVINMTRSLAMEYAKTKLRVNAVAPGGMVTSMTTDLEMPDDLDGKLMLNYLGWRGMAEPDTAAAAICWLASDEASRCHGSILSVDGGLAAG